MLNKSHQGRALTGMRNQQNQAGSQQQLQQSSNQQAQQQSQQVQQQWNAQFQQMSKQPGMDFIF